MAFCSLGPASKIQSFLIDLLSSAPLAGALSVSWHGDTDSILLTAPSWEAEIKICSWSQTPSHESNPLAHTREASVSKTSGCTVSCNRDSAWKAFPIWQPPYYFGIWYCNLLNTKYYIYNRLCIFLLGGQTSIIGLANWLCLMSSSWRHSELQQGLPGLLGIPPTGSYPLQRVCEQGGVLRMIRGRNKCFYNA